jgi:3-isopropylmalate/(R)-2-methylmalate dehydratase small subunit
MSLPSISSVSGRGVFVPGDDIDTDRIIPARFMKCVTFDGLGQYLFHDARADARTRGRLHPLDDPRFNGASILLSGNNFGCGSSREHAPQAIYRAGFRAIVAEGYAEIFFGNSTQLGMPCVRADRADIARLAAAIGTNPDLDITIDLDAMQIRCAGDTIPCAMPDGARQSLLSGRWDPLADLLEAGAAVDAVARRLPYMAAP